MGAGRLLYLAAALAALLAGCRPAATPVPESSMTRRPLVEVLNARSPELIAIPGVTAVAESRTRDGRPCVLILVVALTPELRSRLPRDLEGWPVVVEESGEIRAMPETPR